VGPIAKFVGRFQRKRAEAVAASISRHGPSARVLDIGCGNGGFLSALGELGIKNLEGTEYSEAAARRVAPRAGIKVHVGDLLDLNLPPKHYAAITMWHVLEHVRDPHATLLRCKEILKPGGQIHIALPNQDSNQARRFGKHWFHLDPPRHLHGFGPTSMVRLLRRSGFNMVDLNTFSFEQDPYGWIQSLLNTKGFPRDRAYATLKRVGKHGNAERLTDLALVALLVPYGVAAAVLSPLVDRGGTLTLVAQKD
jgi:SAM-dependent methyltransferase